MDRTRAADGCSHSVRDAEETANNLAIQTAIDLDLVDKCFGVLTHADKLMSADLEDKEEFYARATGKVVGRLAKKKVTAEDVGEFKLAKGWVATSIVKPDDGEGTKYHEGYFDQHNTERLLVQAKAEREKFERGRHGI
jgi:asparagine synthetase A